jgi:regulator of sirC expression with transglutaminase-like and TPR domain
MTDPTQLPYLIKLLDDESSTVRHTVLKQLTSFGPSLEEQLAHLDITLTAEQLDVIQPVLDNLRGQRLVRGWPNWFILPEDKKKLEAAMGLIAEFQLGRNYHITLKELLDQLTLEYSTRHRKPEAQALARFLFEFSGLSGAPQQDYYNPLNSNLVSVIERRWGLPISLACIYILVGHRLGLQIEGCNFPGHFLAIALLGKNKVIVDCYNGGRLLHEDDLKRINATISLDDILRLECQAPAIIARVLHNLIAAYQQANEETNERLMEELLRMMEKEVGTLT